MDNEMIVRKILTKAVGNIEDILAGKIDRCDATSGVCLQVSKACWSVLDDLGIHGLDAHAEFSSSIGAILMLNFKSWPIFSGNLNYPVPCESFTCPMRAFDHHMDKGDMWDISTQYGRDRIHLARWVVEGFKGYLGIQ